MFTGIVEEVGYMKGVRMGTQSGEIRLRASKVLEGTQLGDSIAVNGVCLTVTSMTADSFTADVMPETLRRSNLGRLKVGDPVDLERAMAADGRFGGHLVSGHIDGTGTITEQKREGNAVWVRIQAPADILRLIVEKGSITIDGISLTVAELNENDFRVSIIPHTGSETILLGKRPGDIVNLENDIVGKYVEKLLHAPAASSGTSSGKSGSGTTEQGSENRITWEFLAENGF